MDIPFEAEIPHSATPSFESAFDSQNIAYVRYFLVARNTAAKTSATLEIAVHPLPAPFPPPQTRHFPVDRPTENGVFASKTCSRSWLCLLPRRSVGLEMRLAMQSFAQLSQFSFAVAVSNAQRVRYLKASVVKVLSCRGYSAAFVVASEKFHPEHLDLGGLEGGCRKTLNVRFLVDESCAPSFRGQFLRLDYYVVVKARVGLFEEVRVERRVFVEAAREFLRPEVFGGGRRLEGVCGRVCGKDGNCEPAREEAKAESESLAGPVPPPIPPQFIIPPLIPRNFGDAPISGVSSPDSTFVTASGRFQTPISTPEPFPSIIVPPPIPSDSLSSGGCEEKGFLTRYPPLFQAMPMARFLGGGQRQVFCNPRASLWRMGNETKEVNSAGEK